MSDLNKIFFGPAGTGKTRKAIEEAVKIVKESDDKYDLNFSEFDISTYKGSQECFQAVSNLPKLDITHSPLVKDIHNLQKDVDSIVENLGYQGYLKKSLKNPKSDILKYRLYPLIEIVTFHPSYSYQDFVEGITVNTNEKTKNIEYSVKDGIFKKICNRAIDNPTYNYVLIIDEINRGDISSIFGELFTLLEDDKRKGNREELSINLPYSKDEKGNPKKLLVPKNLYILATMNTVDKSIALIDVALRRRFDFIECMPNSKLKELKKYKEIDLDKLLLTINARIAILKNEHYQIGHSYFLKVNNFNDLKNIMIKSIIPLLQEYFYDDWQSICAVLNQSYKETKKNEGLLIKEKSGKDLFKKEFDELIAYSNQTLFKINENFTEQDIKNIYE